jgi:hypothetical protein
MPSRPAARIYSLPFLFLGVAAPTLAQNWYPKHNFTLGLGAGLPRGDLTQFLNTSFGLGVSYGYRFHRYLQVDGGFDTLFHSAGVEDYVPVAGGYLAIRDYQHMLFGGLRGVLPMARERVQFSGGVGGAWLWYAERLNQPGYYVRYDCPYCESRYGGAGYGVVSIRFSPTASRMFWIGASGKVYRGFTDGGPIGPIPGVRTRDHWLTIFGDFGVSF